MIRVEVLGGLRVYRNGVDQPGWGAKRKRAAIIAYLAVEGHVMRERLCFLVWPDTDPDRARHALSQSLYALKQELGSAWLNADGERLVAGELACDAREVLDLVERERFSEATELYRGLFLDGVRLGGGPQLEQWVDSKRLQLHRALRGAFRHSFAEGTATAEVRVRLARAWVAIDPLDDEAQHALIEALAEAGDRREALRTFDTYEQLIRKELEIEPLDQTRALVERIKGEPDLPEAALPLGGRVEQGPLPARRSAGLGPDVQVARVIGEGSAGCVYLAREAGLKRLVAVKVLHPKLARDPKARARFEREAQAAARIHHPNVVPVFRVGVADDGSPFFVMPYVRGVTLAHLMRGGPTGSDEARRLLAILAGALDAAHAVGIVHRDLRPANVIIEDATGRPLITDFGIARVLESNDLVPRRLTSTGEELGDPAYVSPEQRQGHVVDGRSDVYSLAVLGWELLTGRPEPVRLGDRDEVLGGLFNLLQWATMGDARERPTAAVFARELASGSQEGSPAWTERKGRITRVIRNLRQRWGK